MNECIGRDQVMVVFYPLFVLLVFRCVFFFSSFFFFSFSFFMTRLMMTWAGEGRRREKALFG